MSDNVARPAAAPGAGGAADASLPATYFDDVYRAHDDPWRFETSPYEAHKYRATIDALGGRRFDSGFEIGCSIGVLSAMLAGVCARLLSVDVSEAPLARARARLVAHPRVRLQRMRVPDEWPTEEAFDLVVMSEVGYYWSRDDLARATDRIEASLVAGGYWLLVHWTPPVHDYPLRGDEVHEHALARCGEGGAFEHAGSRRHDTWRLDLLCRRG